MKRVIRQANLYKEGREFESRRPSSFTPPPTCRFAFATPREALSARNCFVLQRLRAPHIGSVSSLALADGYRVIARATSTRTLLRTLVPTSLLIPMTASRSFRSFDRLSYDEDFDRIADVTGQPMSWVAPRGTL